MAEPKSMEEYQRLFYENQVVDGHGFEAASCRMPCPFCAAPDFMVYKIVEVELKLVEGAVCKQCERGARALVTRGEDGSSFIEMIQTVGRDAPEWMRPKMRRVTYDG